jgi:hypothetical protein
MSTFPPVRSVKVAPSPFCESHNTKVARDESGRFYVTCKDCEAQGPHDAIKSEAVEWWVV